MFGVTVAIQTRSQFDICPIDFFVFSLRKKGNKKKAKSEIKAAIQILDPDPDDD